MSSTKEPFIAYYFKGLEEAQAAARKAGVDEDRVIAGLVRLWQHCWRKKTTHIARGELGLFFKGATEKLRQALAVDFLRLDDGELGDHVRGAEQYLRIREARSKGGHASKGNLNRGKVPGSSRDPAGDQPEDDPGCAPALTSSSDQRSATKDQPAPEPPDPPGQDLEHHHVTNDEVERVQGELWKSICARRADEGLPRELSPPRGFRAFVVAALAERFQPEHLQVGHAAYLLDKDFQLAGWPTAVFITPNVWRCRAKAAPRRARDSLTGVSEAYL